MVTIFRLAVDLAHLAAVSAEGTEPLNTDKEARRLCVSTPTLGLTFAEVAALQEEADAASALIAQPAASQTENTRSSSMNQVPSEKLTVRNGDDSKWWISSAGPADGPYVDEQSAIDAAIDRAKALAETGHASTVVIQRGSEWAEIWPTK